MTSIKFQNLRRRISDRMKTGLMYTVCLILKLIYMPIKLFRQKQKVVFISRQADKITLDFSLLTERLQSISPEIEIVVLTKKLNPKDISYAFHMIQQMYHISTSKVVVLDGYCIVASVLRHKPGTFILQMWHALGCIKKFGYQALDTEEGNSSDTARIMKMHANYNAVICASKVTGRYYEEAFHVSPDKIRIWGMPRVDYIKNVRNPRQKILDEHPELRGKEIILYIPTFRKGRAVDLDELVQAIDRDRYQLIVKLHPLDATFVSQDLLLEKEYGTYELIKFADYVITDYSAVSIEASIQKKPVYFFLYDLEEYRKGRGLNTDIYHEIPDAVSMKGSEIIKKIEQEPYDYIKLERFCKKYVQTLNFDNTQKIAEEIVKRISGGTR